MIAFSLVIAKFITKRLKNKAVDLFLMKIHRPASYVLIAMGLLHGILSFFTFDIGFIPVYILGFICLLAIAAAMATYIFRKKLGARWLIWHRITTIIAFVAFVLHPIVYEM
jgi:hypothetical protein